MAALRPRRDRYGKPLPTLADASKADLSATPVNIAQRQRLLQRLAVALERHCPDLLHADVTADITVSFKIVRGTIQHTMSVGIVREYHHEEE
jgi:hypothetical protein